MHGLPGGEGWMQGGTPIDQMTEGQAMAEWADLAERLTAANLAYHRDDAPTLSDADYDG